MMIRKIRSKYSGVLEITYDRGQKVLDSRNTSYSYGNLQRVWDKVLQRIDLKNINRILILGMGAGSSIQLLREKYNYDRKIVAIELDPVIVEIARDEFGIRPDKNLRIETTDAAEYVRRKTHKFDLILIDLFIDNKVPDILLQRPFWEDTAGKTAPGGIILFNAFLDDDKLETVIHVLRESGHEVEIWPKINGANMMIYAIKTR
jgi:spermidine synthase